MPAERQSLFLDRLRDSQLLQPAQLQELAGLPEARASDPQARARLVFKRGWLTRYQLNQVGQGRWLSFTGSGSDLRLFDLAGDPPQESEKPIGKQVAPGCLRFSGDGRTLALAGIDNAVRRWDLTGSPPRALGNPVSFPEILTAVGLNRDGQKMVVAFWSGKVELWDLAAAEPRLVASAKGHSTQANSCFFTPDGKSYFSTDVGKSAQSPPVVVWWDGATGRERKEWVMPAGSPAGAISPDGRYLALACADNIVSIMRLPGEAPTP